MKHSVQQTLQQVWATAQPVTLAVLFYCHRPARRMQQLNSPNEIIDDVTSHLMQLSLFPSHVCLYVYGA